MYENNQYPKHYWIQFSKYCVPGRQAAKLGYFILYNTVVYMHVPA